MYVGINMKKMKTDIIVISIIIFTAVISYFLIDAFFMGKGNVVQIYQNNKLIKELSLKEDITYKIENDNQVNVIKIEKGMVVMTEANCPDKLCINQGSISSNGESIICLPHKVVIKISKTR